MMAVFCTGCGLAAEDGDAFCARCGRELRKNQSNVARPAVTEPVVDEAQDDAGPVASPAPPAPAPPAESSTELAASVRSMGDASRQQVSTVAEQSARRPAGRQSDDREPTERVGRSPLGWVLVACGAVLVVGNWMSWYRVSDGFFISEASGNDLSAGAVSIFIIGGILLGVLGVAHAQGRGSGPAMAIGGAIIAVIAFLLGWAQADDVSMLEEEGFDASIGTGLLLMMFASVTALVVSVLLARRRMP